MRQLALAVVAAALVCQVGLAADDPPESVATVVERYAQARGGVDRWRQVETLELMGSYAAFSQRSPFVLVRKRGDLYRLDFELLGSPAIRARDEQGPWMLHGLLQPEAGRVTDEPYDSQLRRESVFEPLLFDYASKGIGVELVGLGEVDGIETIDLALTLPGGGQELWHLDTETYCEVAIDSEVVDLTQFEEPVSQRIFFDDFRPVDGLVIPHSIEMEFGARLESMTIEEVIVNPELESSRFQMPSSGE